MNLRFAVKHAAREARSSGRRIGVYMGAITLGVAALVAINSFRASVIDSVNDESRTLLGADLRLTSSRVFPEPVQAVIDSLAAAGNDVSPVTSTISVALSPAGATRLIQLRAVEGGFPFYGEFVTTPPGQWSHLPDARQTLVEPAVLAALGVAAGDSIRIGDAWFRIAGVVENLPPEVSFQGAMGPRVFIAARWLDETGLLRFGSLARYAAYVRIPDDQARESLLEGRRELFRTNLVGWDTAAEQGEQLAFVLDSLGRFLGLVGLTALLLGGLGVASAVNVFVKDKRPIIAVLRCLGATQATAFVAYLMQAAMLGLGGAAAGVVLGLGLQAALPSMLGDVLPVDVGFSLRWGPVLAGLGIGVWVSTVFALLPLLDVRGVSPLQALRLEVEGGGSRRDPWRWLAWAGLLASIAAISIWQAGRWQQGAAYATGLTVAIVALRLSASGLSVLTRRFFPRRARFVVRQGIASLFRPHNQTAAVTVALGFGVFLIATLWTVQRNLLDWIRVEAGEDAPNLVAFDVQSDQRADIARIFEANGVSAPEFTPIVTARIAAINGREARDILEDSLARREIEGWTLRREYRNTYRSNLTDTEELVAGEWFDGTPAPPVSESEDEPPRGRERRRRRRPRDANTPAPVRTPPPADAGTLPRISMEREVARGLNVGVGDVITWDVQGVRVETRIASLRTVDWARFETNFFVVFEPGVLDEAPQNFVALVRVPDAAARTRVQRDVVRAHANVSIIDIALVQETLTRIVDRAALAIRFMALFSVFGGGIVLLGAIAASRFQRMRESVLLRALGATRSQVVQVLFTEYAALGGMAGLVGVTLGGIASWALITQVFDIDFTAPVATLVGLWAIVAALAVVIGLANSREVLTRTPLAVLRDATE